MGAGHAVPIRERAARYGAEYVNRPWAVQCRAEVEHSNADQPTAYGSCHFATCDHLMLLQAQNTREEKKSTIFLCLAKLFCRQTKQQAVRMPHSCTQGHGSK